LLSDRGQILYRWAEHFEFVLNQLVAFDDSVLDEIPQWNNVTHLDQPPTEDEVLRAIRMLSSSKSPGAHSIPPEICKGSGNQLVRRPSRLFLKIWENEAVPQNFKDALIVHLFKNKGDDSCEALLKRSSPTFYSTGYLLMFTTRTFCLRVHHLQRSHRNI